MITQQQIIKPVGDVTALSALAGWIVGILPSIATLFTIIWFGILITEKVTGRQFVDIVRSVCRRIKSFFNRGK